MRCKTIGIVPSGKTSEAVLLAQMHVFEPLARHVLGLQPLPPIKQGHRLADVGDRFASVLQLVFAMSSDKGSENSSGLAGELSASIMDPAQGAMVRVFCDAHGHSNAMKAACTEPMAPGRVQAQVIAAAADEALPNAAAMPVAQQPVAVPSSAVSARSGAAYANLVGPLLACCALIRKSPAGHNAIADRGGVRLKVESACYLHSYSIAPFQYFSVHLCSRDTIYSRASGYPTRRIFVSVHCFDGSRDRATPLQGHSRRQGYSNSELAR